MVHDESDEGEAARWAIRRDARPLTPEDQAAFDAWLAGDERRKGALLRAEAVLVYLDRGRALRAPEEPETDAQAEPAHVSRRTIIAAGGVGIAAAAAGLLGVILASPREGYSTAVGEVRRVPLADGSTATVNTASRIAVAMRPERREIRVQEGEVWFEVAHDTRRPFLVEAGDVLVRAVGTAFSVRRHANGIDVLVTEGAVEAWRASDPQARIRIRSGQRSFVSAEASPLIAVAAEPEIERALAWRNGELALNGEPLSYAVEELNRYNRRRIVVIDPAIGRTPIVGYFRTGEPAEFARAVAGIVGGRVESQGDEIRLLSAEK
ncbi:FecR domain-containing protein [Sphingomonas sp.]|uniref:FecR family protein n=1 Tax=Sphingomonas sp. TaxID=28214 RepID=UPI0031DD318B